MFARARFRERKHVVDVGLLAGRLEAAIHVEFKSLRMLQRYKAEHPVEFQHFEREVADKMRGDISEQPPAPGPDDHHAHLRLPTANISPPRKSSGRGARGRPTKREP